MVRVLSSVPLDHEYLVRANDQDLVDALSIPEYYFDDQETRDMWIETFMVLNLDNDLILIHGFPGDNSVGVIVDKNFKIKNSVGQCASQKYTYYINAIEDDDVSDIIDWYDEITDCSMTYEDLFWYPETTIMKTE